MMGRLVTTRPGDQVKAVIVIVCAGVLPVSILESGWAPRASALLFVCLLSLACGALIGPARLPRAARWPLITLAGLALAMSNAGLFNVSIQAATSRIVGWGTDLRTGRVVEDPKLVTLWATLLIWWTGYSAAHGIASGSRALHALLPTTLALTIHSIYVRYNPTYILLVLFGLVILMAWTAQDKRQANWIMRRIDYPDDWMDWTMSTLLITSMVCALAWLFPFLTSKTTIEWMEKTFNPAVSKARQTFVRISGGATPVPLTTFGPGNTANLPSSRLVSDPPQLADKVVMWVWTDEPPPIPEDVAMSLPPEAVPPSPANKPGWRGLTFSIYTGRGWSNPPLTGRPLSSLSTTPTLAGDLTQYFEIVVPHGDTIFAVNEPVSGSVGLIAQYTSGAGMDLIGLRGVPSEYTVTSRTITADEDMLREAPTTYPPEIAPYLQLPSALPQRVRDLAAQVTTGATTPYDKATSIETFLRTYTYTLDAPAPPAERDLVDYFLFDAPGGYCDHYASAMVVMLRSVGVPARLASGYTRGMYDDQRGAYRVTGLNAHSWPEVYFAGIGWVEFEPTAARPLLTRPRRATEVVISAGQVRAEQAHAQQLTRLAWIAASLTLLIGAAAIHLIRRERQLAALPADAAIPLLYQRLRQRGVQMGLEVRPSDTPDEFVTAFNQMIRQCQARWRVQAQVVQQAAARIGELYSQASYSPRQPGAFEVRRAWEAWRALQLRIWLFQISNIKHRISKLRSRPRGQP